MRSRFPLPAAVVLIPLALGFTACSDSGDTPGTVGDGTREFQGAVDPGAGTFLLESIDSVGVDGVRIRIDLLGSDLRVNADSMEVSLAVAVRNRGETGLHAPAEIVIHDLDPGTVLVLDADRVDCPPVMMPSLDSRDCKFAFDYSGLLGGDGVLSPGETSGPRRWRFRVPGLTGFSFGAQARFGLDEERPRIAGTVFADRNEDGRRQPDEQGFGGGVIWVEGPGLDSLMVRVPEDGRYVIPVTETGLYRLLAVPPPTFAPVRATTPNPLQVLLPPGPDGRPESYLDADFGFANDFPPPPGEVEPVGFWEASPESLQADPYRLLGIRLEGLVFELRVAFSGCSPDHPFALFMVGGFMESMPVQARLDLFHDDRGEMCDAYFERTLRYDLTPILREYRRVYGEDGVVIVNFHAPNGEVKSFRIGSGG